MTMKTKNLAYYSNRTKPVPTSICGCGIAIRDHEVCQACGCLVCSKFTYSELKEYKDVKVCPYCLTLWLDQEKKQGGEISAKKFLVWGENKHQKRIKELQKEAKEKLKEAKKLRGKVGNAR